jgi:hypothetical protein
MHRLFVGNETSVCGPLSAVHKIYADLQKSKVNDIKNYVALHINNFITHKIHLFIGFLK